MFAIAYDSALVEKAVFLATRTDASLEQRLHQVIDPLYEIADDEARQQRFVEAYRAFFAELGLDRLLADLIDERPLITRHVDSCMAREADQRKEESAELLVQEQRRARHALPATGTADSAPSLAAPEPSGPRRTLVLQVCPESLVESGPFALKMRRELLHVSDMIDERFGYDRSSLARLGVPQHVVRDRYRVLWDIYVEGRLVREGQSDLRDEGLLKRAFARVFADRVAQFGPAPYGRVFDAEPLSHATLMEWAQNPEQLFASTRKDDDSPCAAIERNWLSKTSLCDSNSQPCSSNPNIKL